MELQHVPRKLRQAAAAELVRRLDRLGRISDEKGRLTRTFLSPAMAQANVTVAGWMRAAGLRVREDGVGNLIGRWEPAGFRRSGGPRTLVIGSHLDTVRDAGRFDGALGVLAGVSAVQMLRQAGAALPFALEVVGFSEEEGVRFSSAYIGSKGYVGALRASDLSLRDREGVRLRDLVTPGGAAHRRGDLMGYLEVHIEQGPVLEAAGEPLGVVAAIAGQTRGRATFSGQAGHAGTTPMTLRRDALAGAAEWMLSVEKLARRGGPSGLVATVGTLAVSPGAANVIPGEAVLSLDLRHPSDAARDRALRAVIAQARRIAAARGLGFAWEETQNNAAVTCDRRLTRLLSQSGGGLRELVSGAGHDGVVLAQIAPIAMLFVRCRKGLSHHPDEYAAPRDIALALDVLCGAILRLAQ